MSGPCLRPGALPCVVRTPHPPEVPWKRRYLFGTRRVRRKTHGAISTAWKTNSPSAGPIPSENPIANFLQASWDLGRRPTERQGFSKITPSFPGCADEARERPFAVTDAPGIESARESALMRSSTEQTNRYTKEIRYHQSVLHEANEPQAAHGNNTGGPGGPAAGESGWNAPASCAASIAAHRAPRPVRPWLSLVDPRASGHRR